MEGWSSRSLWRWLQLLEGFPACCTAVILTQHKAFGALGLKGNRNGELLVQELPPTLNEGPPCPALLRAPCLAPLCLGRFSGDHRAQLSEAGEERIKQQDGPACVRELCTHCQLPLPPVTAALRSWQGMMPCATSSVPRA